MTKLSKSDKKLIIREYYKNSNATYRSLAKEYGVSNPLISKIINNNGDGKKKKANKSEKVSEVTKVSKSEHEVIKGEMVEHKEKKLNNYVMDDLKEAKSEIKKLYTIQQNLLKEACDIQTDPKTGKQVFGEDLQIGTAQSVIIGLQNTLANIYNLSMVIERQSPIIEMETISEAMRKVTNLIGPVICDSCWNKIKKLRVEE